MGRLSRVGGYIVPSALIVQVVHAFIGAVCLLLAQERAETTITCTASFVVSSLPGSEVALVGLILLVSTLSIVNRVEVADIAGHANIFPPNVEEAELSQIIDQ